MELELEAVHCWLGNCTMENRENASENIKSIKRYKYGISKNHYNKRLPECPIIALILPKKSHLYVAILLYELTSHPAVGGDVSKGANVGSSHQGKD